MTTHEYPYLRTFEDDQYRPVIDVNLSCGAITFPITAIIDSGADMTLISADIAPVLGIDLSQYPKDRITGIVAGGSDAYLVPVTMVIPEFKDDPVDTKVLFVPGLVTGMLIGQEGFFDKFQVSFDKRRKKFKLSL